MRKARADVGREDLDVYAGQGRVTDSFAETLSLAGAAIKTRHSTVVNEKDEVCFRAVLNRVYMFLTRYCYRRAAKSVDKNVRTMHQRQ